MTGWCHPQFNGPFSPITVLECGPLHYGAHDFWIGGLWATIVTAMAIAYSRRDSRFAWAVGFDFADDAYETPSELPA